MYRFFLTVAITAALAVPAGYWLDGWLRAARQRQQAEFELRVERELDQPISLAEIAGEEPTVLKVLKHAAKQVDLPMAYRWGIQPDAEIIETTQIQVPCATLSLRSVLGIISRQASVDYYSDGSRLVITSGAEAMGRLTTRVYPLPQVAGPEQPFGADADSWIEVISTVIEPDSWDDVGGPAEIIPIPNALIIRQSRRAHDRIRQFFQRLEDDPPTPDAQADYLSSFSPEERRIHAVLEAPCDFQCTSAPLYEVIDALSIKHRIPIVLCQRQLEEAAIDLKEPLTLKMAGASLRSVLRSLFDQQSLTYVIRDDVLQVTTPEDAYEDSRAVMYDVRDLVAVAKGGADFDSLEDLITTSVDPASWSDVNGPGPFQELGTGWLAFRESDPIHEGTADLLTQLRAALRARSGGTHEAAARTPAERKIAAALERTIKLDYQGVVLQEVVADLAEQTGVNIRLDKTKLEEVSIRFDTPITCELPPLPLKTALRQMLLVNSVAGYELGWCVRDESLVLTTQMDANTQFKLLILDVAGLVESKEDANSFEEEKMMDLIETMVGPRNTNGAADISTFQSLLVISAPREVNAKIQSLVEGVRKFRDESLVARARSAERSVASMAIGDEDLPPEGQQLRIYPVEDLLGADGLSALDDLESAITDLVQDDTWFNVGAEGKIVAVPPGALLVSQTRKGHQQLQEFLDELRRHMAPNRPVPDWLVRRDQLRQELELALSSREQIVFPAERLNELTSKLQQVLGREVVLNKAHLAYAFQDLPPGRGEFPPDKERSIQEQLASRGLAIQVTDQGLELVVAAAKSTLAIYDVRSLLAPRGTFDEAELAAILDFGYDSHAPEWLRMGQQGPVGFRGWLLVRGNDARLEQCRRMLAWLQDARELPRVEEVYGNYEAPESAQLLRRLLAAENIAEQHYLAFLLQNADPPESGLEELAARVKLLAAGDDRELELRLRGVLHHWLVALTAERLEALFHTTSSALLRRGAIQVLSSRRDAKGVPTLHTGEIEKLIAERHDLSQDELAELDLALARGAPPPTYHSHLLFLPVSPGASSYRIFTAPRDPVRNPPWRMKRQRGCISVIPVVG